MSKIKIEITPEALDKWEEAVQKVVRENPGRPIPTALLRWLFNTSTDEDLKVALARLDVK